MDDIIEKGFRRQIIRDGLMIAELTIASAFPNSPARIKNLWVSKGHRRQGLGTLLVKTATKELGGWTHGNSTPIKGKGSTIGEVFLFYKSLGVEFKDQNSWEFKT